MLPGLVTGLLAALLAAWLFGVLAVVQAAVVRRHGLLSVPVAGVAGLYVLGWLLHLVAIARLPLYLAQVAIAPAVAVTAYVGARRLGERLTAGQWVAVAVLVGGLAVLALAAGPVGEHDFDAVTTAALWAGVVVVALLGALAARWRWHSGPVLAVLSGLAFSGSPVASRALVDLEPRPADLLSAACVGLYGVTGFVLFSVALRRMSAAGAAAPMTVLQTVVPAVVGIVALGDTTRPGWWAPAAVAFAASVAGATVLAVGPAGRMAA